MQRRLVFFETFVAVATTPKRG